MELPDTLREKIGEARRRLQSHRRWETWLAYALPLSAGCLAFAIVTRFVHISSFPAVIGLAGAVVFGAAGILALRVKVGDFPAAVQLDVSAGLGERVSTVVEVSQKEMSGELIDALIADADSAVKDVSPHRSIVFRAPLSLPFTLAFVIITVALVLAPRSFGTARAGLPENERIAINEALRLATSADLLDEAGASPDVVEQVRKASRELEDGKTRRGQKTIQAVRARLGEEFEKALQKETVLAEMDRSAVLEKLSKLLAGGAAEEKISAEAESVAREAAAEAAAVIKEIVRKFECDSDLLREMERAIKALEEKDAGEFAKAIEDFRRKAAKVADSEALRVAKRRLEGASDKLEETGGGVLAGKGHSNGSTAGTPGENGSASVTAEGPVLEDAMSRENVPDRFKNLIREYFSRNGNYRRNGR